MLLEYFMWSAAFFDLETPCLETLMRMLNTESSLQSPVLLSIQGKLMKTLGN